MTRLRSIGESAGPVAAEARRLDALLRGHEEIDILVILANRDAVNNADLPWVLVSAMEALAPGRSTAATSAAHAMLFGVERREPAWTRQTASDLLSAVARFADLRRWPATFVWLVLDAAQALDGRDRVVAAEAASTLLRVKDGIPTGRWPDVSYLDHVALARLAGEPVMSAHYASLATEAAGAPLLELELEELFQLPFEAFRVRPAQVAAALAVAPTYAVVARSIAEALDERLNNLHTGRIPYRSDHAVDGREIESVIRAYSVAAILDEPWFGPLAARSMPRLAIPPNSGRTAPGQTVVAALAETIAAHPLPESVAALAAAASGARHPLLKKRLERTLRASRKALARSPRAQG